MRTLALSALALVIAAPAFAASPEATSSATYSMEVSETCSIDASGVTAVNTIVLGTAVNMPITIDCNTEFKISVTGPAGAAIQLTNQDNVESSGDYTDIITGTATKATNTASDSTGVTGDYKADNDFDPEINITFVAPAVALEAGNYEGDVMVTVTGEDVTS